MTGRKSCRPVAMPIAVSAAPSANAPVSPIKTFAGCTLKHKNAMHAPVTDAVNIVMLDISVKISALDMPTAPMTLSKNIKRNVDELISVTPVARPSSPSVKFTLLTIARSTNIVNGIKPAPICHNWADTGIITKSISSQYARQATSRSYELQYEILCHARRPSERFLNSLSPSSKKPIAVKAKTVTTAKKRII